MCGGPRFCLSNQLQVTPRLLVQGPYFEWCPWSESRNSSPQLLPVTATASSGLRSQKALAHASRLFHTLCPCLRQVCFLPSKKTLQNIKSNLAAACYPANAVERSGRCKGMDSELLLSILTRLGCGWLIIQTHDQWQFTGHPAIPATRVHSPSTGHARARAVCAGSH